MVSSRAGGLRQNRNWRLLPKLAMTEAPADEPGPDGPTAGATPGPGS
jgi:hypothetical protein